MMHKHLWRDKVDPGITKENTIAITVYGILLIVFSMILVNDPEPVRFSRLFSFFR